MLPSLGSVEQTSAHRAVATPQNAIEESKPGEPCNHFPAPLSNLLVVAKAEDAPLANPGGNEPLIISRLKKAINVDAEESVEQVSKYVRTIVIVV
jgi:hypothetical protein